MDNPASKIDKESLGIAPVIQQEGRGEGLLRGCL